MCVAPVAGQFWVAVGSEVGRHLLHLRSTELVDPTAFEARVAMLRESEGSRRTRVSAMAPVPRQCTGRETAFTRDNWPGCHDQRMSGTSSMHGIVFEPAGIHLQWLGFVPGAHGCELMLPAQAARVQLGASGDAAWVCHHCEQIRLNHAGTKASRPQAEWRHTRPFFEQALKCETLTDAVTSIDSKALCVPKFCAPTTS